MIDFNKLFNSWFDALATWFYALPFNLATLAGQVAGGASMFSPLPHEADKRRHAKLMASEALEMRMVVVATAWLDCVYAAFLTPG